MLSCLDFPNPEAGAWRIETTTPTDCCVIFSDDNLGIFSTELQRVSLGLHEISLSLKNLFPTSIFPKAV